MTTAPLTPSTVTTHIRRLTELVAEFGHELGEMHKLEAALQAAIDRLERGANLVNLEARHVETIIRRDDQSPPRPKVVATIVDKVSADLDRMIVEGKTVAGAVKAPGA